jgi:hypothetical protein
MAGAHGIPLYERKGREQTKFHSVKRVHVNTPVISTVQRGFVSTLPLFSQCKEGFVPTLALFPQCKEGLHQHLVMQEETRQ